MLREPILSMYTIIPPPRLVTEGNSFIIIIIWIQSYIKKITIHSFLQDIGHLFEDVALLVTNIFTANLTP